MIKTILIIGATLSLNLYAKDGHKMEKQMNAKIIQVQLIAEMQSDKLENRVNKFLIDKKIKRDDLIDIKFTTSDYKRALIIYEVNYEDK